LALFFLGGEVMKIVIDVKDEAEAKKIAVALRGDSAANGVIPIGFDEVAAQFAGLSRHLDLGPSQSVCRHARQEGARLVAAVMGPLTNVRVSVVHEPASESESARGVGDWNIHFQNGREHGPCFSSHRMSRLAEFAETLVLADALRRVDPLHPLLATWRLREENREKLSHYYA
jgi:hypothetical protein